MKHLIFFVSIIQLLRIVAAQVTFDADSNALYCPSISGNYCFGTGKNPTKIAQCFLGSLIHTFNCDELDMDDETEHNASAICFETSKISGDAVCYFNRDETISVPSKTPTSTDIRQSLPITTDLAFGNLQSSSVSPIAKITTSRIVAEHKKNEDVVERTLLITSHGNHFGNTFPSHSSIASKNNIGGGNTTFSSQSSTANKDLDSTTRSTASKVTVIPTLTVMVTVGLSSPATSTSSTSPSSYNNTRNDAVKEHSIHVMITPLFCILAILVVVA